ncbi:MAG TPA: MEDS domain-containing protein [Terriglobales bacterium]|nr:MEDS domain-containing protein [Terriglobales bacterium]
MVEARPKACRGIERRISDYLEGQVTSRQRADIRGHLRRCRRCAAVFEGVRNLRRLAADPCAFPLPAGFSQRLRRRIQEAVQPPALLVPLGVGDAMARSGDHVGYFWESEPDFEAAVGFLEAGLRGRDAGFIFGHPQANQRVLAILSRHGFDVARLAQERRLFVLEGKPTGQAMLEDIAAAFKLALDAGAPLLRLLGNIGWGRPDWPPDDAILEFESRVTVAAKSLPAVIVCMYDVAALPGRILLKGGFETHPLTYHDQQLEQNPHHVPNDRFLALLQAADGRIQ